MTKGYNNSTNNNNGGLSKPPHHNNSVFGSDSVGLVDDDSGRATSQTTNSGNGNTTNNSGTSHHYLFPSPASPIGTGRATTIGHAVTRPLSATGGGHTLDPTGAVLLFHPAHSGSSANTNDSFFNPDAAFTIQRSQSAAPSMNSHNNHHYKNSIGTPPGLGIPERQTSESFVSTFSSPFSSSSPFGASSTTSLGGGGIRRPASAGVVGGSSLYHSSSSGAVRPAAKTLMELIQEESVPPPPPHAIPSPAATGTNQNTPSPPQTQSGLPSMPHSNNDHHHQNNNNSNTSSNTGMIATMTNNSNDPTDMYSHSNSFGSQPPQFLATNMGGGDIRITTAANPPESTARTQFRHDQGQQEYRNSNNTNYVGSAPVYNIDYVVDVPNHNTKIVSNDVNQYNGPSKMQYKQQQQHIVRLSDSDPQQQQTYSTYNPNNMNNNSVIPQYQGVVNGSNMYRPNVNEFVVEDVVDQQQMMMQAPIYIPQQLQPPQQQQQHQFLQNGQPVYYSNVQQQQPTMHHQSTHRMQPQQQLHQNNNNMSMNNTQQQPQTIYLNANGQIQQQQQQGYGYNTVQYQSHHLQQHQQPQSQSQMLQHHEQISSSTNQRQDQYISVLPIQRGGSNNSVSYWPPNGMVQQQPHSQPQHQHQQVLFPTSGLVTVGGQISNTMDTMYHVPVTNTMKGRDSKASRGRRGTGGRGGGGRDIKSDVPTTSAMLEEFHSAKSRDWTIRRIEGHVVEFCQDQSGSRFIQQRLEMGDHAEQQIVMKEVLLAIRRLRNDVFGNYVVQKLLDFGTAKMKSEIRDTLEGEMLSLSLQMYGCRVVQKAIETVDEEDLPRLLREFHNDVLGCIHDQNGNHVIQKCIEVLNSRANKAEASHDLHRATFLREQIDFILNDILSNTIALSCHPYGCRVLQRILEHCTEAKKVAILNEIKLCHKDLLDDQYGNYVIQHVLQYGRDVDRDSIVQIVVDCGLLGLARQKFASNVVEKLLKYGNNDQRRAVVREMLKVCVLSFLGSSLLLVMK